MSQRHPLDEARSRRNSPESPLEQDGFELVVPPLVSQLAGQRGKRSRSAQRRARRGCRSVSRRPSARSRFFAAAIAPAVPLTKAEKYPAAA